MSIALYIAALLLFLVGVAHSYLGERYILIRLFRREDLPKLFGGTQFTIRTLRFAWHITTIAWWGFAGLLVHLASGSISRNVVAMTIGITFLATGLVTLAASRAKHLAWPVFILIGIISLWVGAT
ncbi:MAG: hypothetical protein IPP58_13375 [Holophagaceae bacterium]|uniref:Uncharacterized protein n=1 Tax=Candidatus Geothrix skivensis TaxID=2954439 RepID=A0A9D7XHK2_9BACT|nr:hypothetical protein [Candidatus Geothrix skivensis]